MKLQELLAMIRTFEDNGSRFQFQIAELVSFLLSNGPMVAVETGVNHGVSTGLILEELHRANSGFLHSVDPSPQIELEDERWKLWRMKSDEALTQIYRQTGPWQFFLHDSDHEVWCQTYEYELAWNFLAPGGVLATDDSTWGTPEHKAWPNFLKRHELAHTWAGSARYVVKGEAQPVRVSEIDAAELAARRLADYATMEYSRK